MKNKKWLKKLAALAVGTLMVGTLAFAACDNGNGGGGGEGGGGGAHSHVWSTSGTNKGNGKHELTCTGEGTCPDGNKKQENHNTSGANGTCSVCGYNPNAGGVTTGGSFLPDAADVSVNAGDDIVNNDLYSVTAELKMTSAALTSKAPDEKYVYGYRQNDSASLTPGEIYIKAKKNLTVKVTASLSDNTYNADRSGVIYYTTGDGLIGYLNVSKRDAACEYEIEVGANETLTISSEAASAAKLWLLAVDATEKTDYAPRAVTGITASINPNSYDLSSSGSATIDKENITVLANSKYLLDDAKWNVSYNITGAGSVVGNGPWTVTVDGAYSLVVTATPKSGSGSFSAPAVSITVNPYSLVSVGTTFSSSDGSGSGACVIDDTSGVFSYASGASTNLKEFKNVSNGIFSANPKPDLKVDGTTYTIGYKIDGNAKLQVSVKAAGKIKLYLGTDAPIKYSKNGATAIETDAPTAVNEGNNCYYYIEIDVEEGTYVISQGATSGTTQGNKENSIFYIYVDYPQD